MTILNEVQQQLLNSVRNAFDDVAPVLESMAGDYEYAKYRAKKSVRDAVKAAQDGGVPMSRIVADGTDLRYAQQLKAWLQPDPTVVERVLEGGDVQLQAADTYTEDIEKIKTVSRHPGTGVFTVMYNGTDYMVPAMGPDAEPWASHEEGIPDDVYHIIADKYPGFVVLKDDEED